MVTKKLQNDLIKILLKCQKCSFNIYFLANKSTFNAVYLNKNAIVSIKKFQIISIHK